MDFLVDELTESQDNTKIQVENSLEDDIEENDVFDDIDHLIEDSDISLEEEENEVEWVPPPIPEAPKSISAKIWDSCPTWIRNRMLKSGVEAPIDATHSSSILVGMGSKGAMLLGPPSAGKTTLIAAINRACLIPVESDIDIRWRASGNEETQYELTD